MTRLHAMCFPAYLGQAPLNRVTLTLLALGGLGMLIALTAMRRRAARAQSATRRAETGVARDAAAETRELGLLLSELDALSRRMHGKLDTRFTQLEAVLRQADERIAQLSRLIRTSEGGPALDVTVADPPPGAGDDQRHTAIYQLADRGHTVAQIARELGRNDGEVELILSLRKVRRLSASGEETPTR